MVKDLALWPQMVNRNVAFFCRVCSSQQGGFVVDSILSDVVI